MNATTFISPLGDDIGRFLQYKRAAGCSVSRGRAGSALS